MKLFLYNFKCYQGTHEFEFADDGLTLISGISGAGKSSLFEAICFALTGTGTGTKYITQGETTCKVVFQYQDVEVTRTCRPNTVQYVTNGAQYEGDEADARIATYFGPYFESLNYVPQQAHKTFLFATPQDKLNILENILFKDHLDKLPSELKKECNEKVKVLTSVTDRLRGKIEVLEARTVQYTPQDIIQDHLTTPENLEIRALFLTNRQRLYDTFVQKVSSLTYSIQDMERELAEYENVEIKTYPWTTDQLHKHIVALESLNFEWKKFMDFSTQDCDEALVEFEQDLATLTEHDKLARQLKDVGYSEVELTDTQEQINELSTIAEGAYSCPACQADLNLINNELLISKKPASQLIDSKEKKRQLDALYKKVRALQAKKESQTKLTQQIEQLVLPEESHADITEQILKWKDYKKRAQKIEHVKKWILSEELSLVEARAQLADLQKIEKSLANKQPLQERIADARDLLEKLKAQARINNLEDASIEIANLEKRLGNEQLHAKLIEEKERYDKATEELTECYAQVDLNQKRREAYQTLKGLISRAEMVYIEQSAREIETLVNVFCSEIFLDHPLTVHLSLFTESKTQGTKPQLDVEIYYKNLKCSYLMLSGGEQARLNICFTLALSKYFKGKLLLLDESTAQLNQEATEVVLETLKRHVNCKTVVVAHQVVEGIFDEVVRV